nr:immunoglobulin heavy chain junction region [Macaca mulatta]MOY29056.1 immunoglobulin heavy chain junction region [Macaca mulatta]
CAKDHLVGIVHYFDYW